MTTVRTAATDDRDVIEDIIAGFRSGMRELRCVASERMLRQGVSMTQHHVLMMLDRHGEMPMSRLADMLDVSVSNATGIVDRLEGRGVIERVRAADDRRVVLVRITDRGRDLLGEAEVVRDDILQTILGRLDEAQLDRVARAMEDLRGAVTAMLDADPRQLPGHVHAHRQPDQLPSPGVDRAET